MGLPQHSGGFSTLRFTSPVQLTSYSWRVLRPHRVHWKVGVSISPWRKLWMAMNKRFR
jgi:hypothetical protein